MEIKRKRVKVYASILFDNCFMVRDLRITPCVGESLTLGRVKNERMER